MKKLTNIFFFLLLAGTFLYSCKPESFDDVKAPSDVAASIAGTWRLTKVIQTDEDAKAKGFTYGSVNVQQMDITSVFPYTDFRLTLNTSGATPSTFTTTPGNAPQIIKLASGNWSFDDPKFPKTIKMTSGTQEETVSIGGYPTAINPTLNLKLERRDAATNKLLVSYSYQFTKQ